MSKIQLIVKLFKKKLLYYSLSKLLGKKLICFIKKIINKFVFYLTNFKKYTKNFEKKTNSICKQQKKKEKEK
jgi:hypothetical protein